MSNPYLFMIAVLTVLATPGPTNTLLATGAALEGMRASLLLPFAELAGYVITVCLVGFVFKPWLTAFPIIADIVKLTVAAYLVWNAVRLWRAPAKVGGVGLVTWRGVFTATLLNPKGLILALAIVPFGRPDVAWYLLAFAIAILVMGSLWLLAGRFIDAVSGEGRRYLPRVAATVLVGFAGLIAASALG